MPESWASSSKTAIANSDKPRRADIEETDTFDSQDDSLTNRIVLKTIKVTGGAVDRATYL